MSRKKIKSSNRKNIKNVILVGPIFTNSGYGVHTRQVFESLRSRKDINLFIQPKTWGNTSWILNTKANKQISDILEYAKKDKSDIVFDESYQVLLPNEWQKIAKKNIGITAGFEADIVKSSWVDYCNQMSSVIVPSEFTKAAFLKTSLENNIKLHTSIYVINEWYYKDFDDIEIDEHLFDELSYDKNILIMSQITSLHEEADRKNIFKTIKTSAKFIENKEIGLVLKIKLDKDTILNREKIKSLVKDCLNENVYNKLFFIFGDLSTKDLKSLYSSKKISCILSGTRAEGWGLPFVEAASCGLPIVATNYSAYKEFLEDDFIGIDYDLKVFNLDTNFVDLNANPVWAEFKEEDMIEKLSLFFSKESHYLQIASKRQNKIKQVYSYNNIIKKYMRFYDRNV